MKTSNFQQQQPAWRDAFCKPAPQPQHGQKAEKRAPTTLDSPVPRRPPAH